MKQHFTIEIDDSVPVFAPEIQGILENYFDDVWVQEGKQ